MTRTLAILIFDEVEVLDFAGPFEVFGVARAADDPETPLFHVYTVAAEQRPIRARNGLLVMPNYRLELAPKPDIILVPGGRGVREAMLDPLLIDWVKAQSQEAELTLSVCTGAWMLAQAGLLKGLRATTYHTGFERLQEIEPTLTLEQGVRWVDNGRVITSAGVSAGIDMSLYILSKLFGEDQAARTARYMEYEHYESSRKTGL